MSAAGPWSWPHRIALREVGPRDGLQGRPPLAVDDRVALIRALADAGLTAIEVGAFVSPRAVPAMARTAEVIARLGPLTGLRRTVLVPNLRGAHEALAAGVDELTVTLSASPEYGRRNIRMTLAESLQQIDEVCRAASVRGVAVDAVVSCAFGSPYDDAMGVDEIAALAGRLRELGCGAVTYADTTGLATPRRVRALVEAVGAGDGMHFHDSRGAALTNVFASLLLGVRRFDASIVGLGGSPFATGAGGNVATEHVVDLCRDLGIATGVDAQALASAGRLVRRLLEPAPEADSQPA
jgi:hydroxymethylglutaryl-CoA lyase